MIYIGEIICKVKKVSIPHVEGHLNRPKCNLGYSSNNINIYIGRIIKLSRQGIIAIRVMTTFRTINLLLSFHH